MKICDTQYRAFVDTNRRLYIKEDLLDCYEKLCGGRDINEIIRWHRKFITGMELTGKKKNAYKTLIYLEHYRNTKNKSVAMMHLTNTINQLGLLK